MQSRGDRVRGSVRLALAATGVGLRGETLLVGVSGGPDSVALLDALLGLGLDFGYRLHVAHLDHRLRGEASDRDARFVEELASRRALASTIETTDVGDLARARGWGVEVAGRYCRHRFFVRLCREVGAVAVALGHTSDDQVETLLLNLFRGTGLAGLSGMRQQTILRIQREDGAEQDELTLLRPLLGVSRKQVIGYVQGRGLDYCSDQSNYSLAYRRNQLRLEILPFLERYTPGLRGSLLRTAECLALDYDLVVGELDTIWERLARVTPDKIEFDLSVWSDLAPSIQREALRRAAATLLRGAACDVGWRHLRAAERLICAGRTGDSVDWPGDLHVERGYGTLAVQRGQGKNIVVGFSAVAVPGTTAIPGTGLHLTARLVDSTCGSFDSASHADVDLDAAGADLRVRSRMRGDRFIPLGMSQSKKLQDFLVDCKVPRADRDGVPILSGSNGIVWVCGLRIDDRVRVRENTRQVLCLTLAQK